MAATATSASRSGAFAYFDGDDDAKARGLFQLLREDGTAVDDAALAGLDRDLARRLFEGMVRIRVTDARMMALQRQGRIGFYGEAMGQEAAVVGSAAATPARGLDRPRAARGRRRPVSRDDARLVHRADLRQRRGSDEGPADAVSPVRSRAATTS